MDALTGLVFVAMVIAWPLAGLLTVFVVRSWRAHDRMEDAEREARGEPPRTHHH